MMNKLELSIINNLLTEEEYARKVIPFLQKEYFSDKLERAVFEEVNKFFVTYNRIASKEILAIELSNRKDLTEQEQRDVHALVESLAPVKTNMEWLLTNTEQFCKKQAVFNAILKSINIIEGKNKTINEDAIPSLLSDALGVSFDTNIGHDYLNSADSRWEFYHRVEEKLAFDLSIFNKITKGGLPKKTLNVALAGTGVGKSLFMCHVAASTLVQGRNVLYITLEMSEERIAERIDANLLDLTMNELHSIDKKIYNSRISKLNEKTQGRLIIKEYPTASAHAGNFRALLEELKTKRDFAPELIVIDYLNICASQRLKGGAGVNSYTYIKSIAEELRGLAVEYNVPVLSATQTTRSGYSSSDVELTDTSESFGLPATVDFMFALINTEELQELGQILVKQLKNRYNDPNYYKKFVIGIDRARMKLYDVEESAQDNLSDSGQDKADDKPLFDKSSFGGRMKGEGNMFDGFNFS